MRKRHFLPFVPGLLVVLLAASVMADGPNLVRNGDFSETDEGGKPKHWQVSFSGKGVEGRTSMVNGPGGGRAIKIECTDFPAKGGAAWVIFKQDSTVNTKPRRKLHISFWVRKENMRTRTVALAIMRIKPWGSIFKTGIPVANEWRKVELIATPRAACDNTRFEIYFVERGVLYLSDIHVAETTKNAVEVNSIRLKMAREARLPAEKNIVWNGSFEAGIDGWGTASFDHNVVKIDNAQARHGKCSARIDFDESSLPVGYSDYPKARKIVPRTVRCVTEGWIRFEKGKRYTLSLYLKSSKDNTAANIGLFFMTRASSTKRVSVTDRWQRYTLSFTARDIFGFAGVGSETKGFSGKLWIDGVQIEKGDRATPFVTRYPAEISFHHRRPGGVYYVGEDVVFDVKSCVRNDAVKANVLLKVLDYRGVNVYETELALGSASAAASVRIPTKGNGHYTLLATVRGDGLEYALGEPFVIVYPYANTYGNRAARFGTNHPYYSDLLQGLARDAGVYWVRDWTLKWDSVEPRKGTWDFSGPEVFFERARRFNLHVLAILPDPSSGWASSGPANTRGKRLGDAFADLWYLPKDMSDYRRYVRTCVERYADVIPAWEVLNEPFKTQGWKVDDRYNELLTTVREEADRADNGLKVLRCALTYFKKDERANAEAVRLADTLSEHIYPRYNDTRQFLRRLKGLEDFLAKHRVETDMWFTEYGKYSDDSPHYLCANFDHFQNNGDERTAAAYNVKYLAALFSHGVSKVFFHQRTWPIGLNLRSHRIHFDMLFDYGPTPHKFFVAANAMSWFLHPGTSGGKPINEEGPVFAYSFKRPKDKLLIVWTDGDTMRLGPPLREFVRELSAYDMMGRQIEKLSAIGDEPVYLAGDIQHIEALETALSRSALR